VILFLRATNAVATLMPIENGNGNQYEMASVNPIINYKEVEFTEAASNGDDNDVEAAGPTVSPLHGLISKIASSLGHEEGVDMTHMMTSLVEER
jgi:hypothetical protein